MTTTPSTPSTALPGRPPVVDRATWQAARDELLVREKAHTREGDALAAARRTRASARAAPSTSGTCGTPSTSTPAGSPPPS
ncbi:DUF899 family protein [Modestobacter excelsi]|uniref:DUF899 family protein n=1 Tax=Modestobacter excelsi TaxID=2213161 RepID=UPI001FEBF92B|nr:DUF899 family protein [Modestobacter excelsi]